MVTLTAIKISFRGGVRFDEEAQYDVTGTVSGYRERDEERGIRFLVDEEGALSKAKKRNSSASLMSLVQRKQRTKVVVDSNPEAD